MIWIDLTDLASWQGRYTGVQRVVHEVARNLVIDPRVKYVFFEKKRGFVEVPSDALANESFLSAPLSLSKRAIQRFDYLSDRLMTRVLPASSAKRIAQRKSDRQVKKAFDVQVSREVATLFSTGDVIVALGRPWKSQHLFALQEFSGALNLRYVQVLHDFLPSKYPHVFQNQRMLKEFRVGMPRVMDAAQLLIANSESTKRDAEEYFAQYGKSLPVVTIRLGDEEHPEAAVRPESLPREVDKYALMVGTVEVRKNLNAIYQAYLLADEAGVELPPLVIAGRTGWLVDDLLYQIRNDPRVKHKFVQVEGPTDAELRWLYENCWLTVYPSWYEGWGLPIAESVSYGKMCVASSTSSMTEIAGDLIVYGHPARPDQFFEHLKFFAENPQKLADAEARIKREYKSTPWAATAQQVLDAVATLDF